MSFEWQTEEEKWEEAREDARARGEARARGGARARDGAGLISIASDKRRWPRRWVLLVGAAGLFIVLGFLLVRRQINERVSDISASIINDVNTSVDVLHEAVRRDDFELFVNLLSGRDLQWADEQQAWFRTGAYLDRASLGLTWLPAQTQVITITLSPDLLAADVLIQEQYAIAVGNQQTQTISLQHQETYRQGRTSWLLSPPESPPSTEPKTYQGMHLTLHYTAADEPTAARLGPDLDKKLAAFCGLAADLACPTAMQVTLAADVAQLANLKQLGWLTQPEPKLALPAPSLVGSPTDEAAYQALFRGYASTVVTAAASQAAGYQCCPHSVYFLALRDYLLHRLGLQPWPLTAADYERILDDPFEPLDAGIHWPGSVLDPEEAADAWQAYVVVHFILAESREASVGRLLRSLGEDSGFNNSFSFWLYSFLPTGPATTRLWFQFLQEQVGTASHPPVPWPEEVIYRLCAPQMNDFSLDLYALNPAAGSFIQTQPLGRARLSLTPLPGDDGLFILENGSSSLVSLWRADQGLQPVTLPENLPPTPILFYAGQAGASPLVTVFNGELAFLHLGRIDPTACATEGCALALLPNDQYTVWSPDGEHALVSNVSWARRQHTPVHQLTLTDGDQQPLADAGSGIFPFWLDAETFGYVRLDESRDLPQPALYLGTTAQPTATLWIEPDTWLPALPATSHTWMVVGLWADTAGRGRYLLLDLQHGAQNSQTQGDRQRALLLVDRRDNSVMRLTAMNEVVAEARFSPGEGDGWLAVAQIDSGSGKSYLTLYDLPQPQPIRQFSSPNHTLVSNFDWAADGQWLVRGEANFTALFAPASNYQRIFVPDADFCSYAAWGNK